MSFPLNALPDAFQEDHGSVDIGADEKPGLDDDEGEDQDLDLDRMGQRVWLVKVSDPPWRWRWRHVELCVGGAAAAVQGAHSGAQLQAL